MKTERYRDLVLTYLDDDTVLVTACDSFGSIGEKECDELKCPAEVVGKVILRTPLLEVMCFGAEIVAVTDIICNEMVTYGERIIRAIKEEMKGAGLDPEMLNGSTEENFVSRMTGIGVVVSGIVSKNAARRGRVKRGDCALLVGNTLLGSDVIGADDEMQVTYSDIRRLLEYEGTKEIVPVGSKGIRYEVENLAGIYSLSFDPQNGKIDLECSGGPSTSAVAVVDEATYDRIRTWSKVRYIGKII